MSASYVDDKSIADNTELFRRIPPWHIIDDENSPLGKRLSSAAFDNDKDGDPMSIALSDTLAKQGRTPEDVLVGHDAFSLVGFTAGLVRNLNQAQVVVRDPILEEPAHGLVIGKKTGSVKKNISKNCRWVVPPSTI